MNFRSCCKTSSIVWAARAVEAFEEAPLMLQEDALLEGEPEIR